MDVLWEFLSDKQNQETLAWLGGGVATAVSALWIAIKYFTAKPGKSVKSTDNKDPQKTGDTLIEGDIHILNTSATAPRWVYAMCVVGLLLLGYAAFFSGGDCVVNGAKVGGDVSGTISITGGSGDVECD